MFSESDSQGSGGGGQMLRLGCLSPPAFRSRAPKALFLLAHRRPGEQISSSPKGDPWNPRQAESAEDRGKGLGRGGGQGEG